MAACVKGPGTCRIFWRYNILYVSERCFESGGRIWDHIFDEVCWCLWILSTFTGAAPEQLYI